MGEKSEITSKGKGEEELDSRGLKRNVGRAKKQGQGRRTENECRTEEEKGRRVVGEDGVI